MENSRQRVVVTGLGVVSPIGNTAPVFWQNLLAGTCGVGAVTQFDTTDYPCRVGAEVKDFDPTVAMDPKEVRRNDPYAHYAMAAAKEAMEDSGLDVDAVDKSRFGVLVGSGIGGMHTIEQQLRNCFERGPRKVSPFMIPSLISNIAAGLIAIQYGARGPNFGLVSACATSAHALGESLRYLRDGYVDVMVAGGSEAAITPTSYAGFCSARAMSTDYNDTPQKASRPFDAKRDGFVMGEGAGVLILETLAHAQKRGARIYGEVAGYAATCDAHHVTMPHPEGLGLIECMEKALADSGVAREEVGYINAHGTSTPYNDKTETAAVRKVFGEHARVLKMSSTKSMTGHLLGAAGGVEAAACLKVLETGHLPPTINYEEPDPECDLDYIPNKAVEAEVEVTLSNSLGFGGHNASLIFRKLRD